MNRLNDNKIISSSYDLKVHLLCILRLMHDLRILDNLDMYILSDRVNDWYDSNKEVNYDKL